METLDEHCQNIFIMLVACQQKVRFNNLYRYLNKEPNVLDTKMTKPTLIKHLDHLQAQGFILQKKHAKQNITYEVNWKKFHTIKQLTEFKQSIKEDERTFKSESPEYQISYVIAILAMEQVFNLQLYVDDIIQPQDKAKHRLTYILINRLFDKYRQWLLDICKESNENTQKASEILAKETQDYQNIVFQHSPKTT